MQIGICDDNEIYLEYIRESVSKLLISYADIEIHALTPSELNVCIQDNTCPYDIIISDIDMGIFNGIDLARKINEINSSCLIIFISNYINYASDTYDAQHIYFILKSELEVRLPKALEKAIKIYEDSINNQLIIRYQNTIHKIAINSIMYVESLGRYLYIHDNKQSYKCIMSYKELMQNISTELSRTFSRCHKSYMINMSYVRSLNRTCCVLENEIKIPISHTYSKLFQDAYVQYISRRISS